MVKNQNLDDIESLDGGLNESLGVSKGLDKVWRRWESDYFHVLESNFKVKISMPKNKDEVKSEFMCEAHDFKEMRFKVNKQYDEGSEIRRNMKIWMKVNIWKKNV